MFSIPINFYVCFCFNMETYKVIQGQRKSKLNISCCHWNVSNLLAQNMCKISQIEAHNLLYNSLLAAYQKYPLKIHKY